MAGDIVGIGDIVTGGLAAGAVSRAAGCQGHARHSTDADIEHGLCLNCGARLSGDYCASCGQSAHIHRSIGAFFHDLVHGVLHFEGKTWRTLPLLAWRPGELTRRYIQGERAHFVSPMALFLFAVFLLFGVASFAGGEPDLGNDATSFRPRIAGEIQSLDTEITRLERQIASGTLDPAKAEKSREKLSEAEQSQLALMSAYRAVNGDIDVPDVSLGKREDQVAQILRSADKDDRDAARDAPLSQQPVVNVSDDELKGLDASWFGRTIKNGVEKARANPALVFYKIKTNAYKFGWALIPLSVPFVWIVMAGRRMRQRHLYDHVIFTTYSIAFMMLLLVVLMVAVMVGMPTGLLALIGIFYPPLHMYRQLRGAYRLSRANAFVRTALLLTVSLFAFSLFVVLLVAAGLVA